MDEKSLSSRQQKTRLAFMDAFYFNMHTKVQVYFGDIRGQVYPVTTPANG